MQTPSLPVLLAFKAITLAPELRDSDRKIAGALLEHFNRKTGQCDPSLETLAILVGINRRTVIRAISRIESLGLFRKVRHGGNFHRNHYEPVWSRFEQIESDWKRRRSVYRGGAGGKNKSPSQCQPERRPNDNGATQTYGINLSDETFPSCTSEFGSARSAGAKGSKGLGSGQILKASRATASSFHVHHARSRDVARDAAQGRWDTELLGRFRTTPQLYARIVEMIDLPLATEATDAELKQRGSGLRYILQELDRRGLAFNSPVEEQS